MIDPTSAVCVDLKLLSISMDKRKFFKITRTRVPKIIRTPHIIAISVSGKLGLLTRRRNRAFLH